MKSARSQGRASTGHEVRSTRRQFMGGVGAAAAAASIAPASAAASSPPDPASADRRVLEGLLDAERMLIYGCRRLLASGLLHQESTQIVELVLRHEREHVLALLQHMLPPGNAGSVLTGAFHPSPDLVSLFSGLAAEVDGIRALVDVKSFAEGNYFRAVGQLHQPRLAQLAAEILACEAQHWSLLSDLSNHGLVYYAVPAAYVRGATQIPPKVIR